MAAPTCSFGSASSLVAALAPCGGRARARDVCVLANAFKNDTLQTPGAIGWRALVTKTFSSQLKDNIQVEMVLT